MKHFVFFHGIGIRSFFWESIRPLLNRENIHYSLIDLDFTTMETGFNYFLFLQIILFLFITPGTPRIVIISYSMNYGVSKCIWTAFGDITANIVQGTLVIFFIGSFFSENPNFLKEFLNYRNSWQKFYDNPHFSGPDNVLCIINDKDKIVPNHASLYLKDHLNASYKIYEGEGHNDVVTSKKFNQKFVNDIISFSLI